MGIYALDRQGNIVPLPASTPMRPPEQRVCAAPYCDGEPPAHLALCVEHHAEMVQRLRADHAEAIRNAGLWQATADQAQSDAEMWRLVGGAIGGAAVDLARSERRKAKNADEQVAAWQAVAASLIDQLDQVSEE